jgi:copper chaperone CopZ
MREMNLYVPSLHCESCERRVRKALDGHNGIQSMAFNDDAIRLMVSESVNAGEIQEKIESLGYRVSSHPVNSLTLGEQFQYFKENANEYIIERKSFFYAFIIFFLLWAVQGLTYLAFFRDTPNFWSSYAWWFFYLNISIAFIGATMRTLLSYKARITHMTGMMIGMTVGMQTGMMIGAVVGATNGFFVGAMTGMVIGVLVGAVMGSCCGVMGTMEGMMAGLMGGTMGPMIAVMMIADNILYFMPLYMAINLIILIGLWYMHHESVVYKSPKVRRAPIDFTTYASASIVACTMLTFIMLFAPRNILAIFIP